MGKQSNYPLYPRLSEEGEAEAQKIIDKFKADISKITEEAIQLLYTDVAVYIESDSWGNFRNQIMDGMMNYDNRKIQNKYDFDKIRKSILKNHREDIINDLNQDLLTENELLKKQMQELREMYDRMQRF